MVGAPAASRFSVYTSFVRSTAATMTARPRGSAARYWPGTARRQPVLPNVSQWMRVQAPLAASKRSTVSVPASDATATSSVAAPVGRTAQSARTQLNVAVLATVARRPVASSGRSSSSAPPCRATTTSCARPAENEPKAAATTAAGGFKVNCTKCIVRSLRAPGLRDARSGHGYRTGAGQDRGRGLHPPL